MRNLNRRLFLELAGVLGMGVLSVRGTAGTGAKFMSGNYFTVGRRGDHWWFIDPGGHPFFSLGMNHIDSATLRYPENIHIWRGKYGNNQERWLRKAVGPDLRGWGFNTIGWCQEVVIRGETIHRHSRNWTFEEYQWADMPYCHLLPFTEAHQWEVETRYPDVFSEDFAEWCDCVAREQCARLADDPKLIGYFYCDCPQWAHATHPKRKGPWFDPERLNTEAGRRDLQSMAERYYTVTRDAIRRYDPHHLILGDRFEANAFLPEEVLRAALPYVDVLSFQYFRDVKTITGRFQEIHALTGKPILLADACVPGRDTGATEQTSRYPAMLRTLRELPCCVGWHYCGAYLKNRSRHAGFLGEDEQPVNPGFIAAVRKANRETTKWVAGHG